MHQGNESFVIHQSFKQLIPVSLVERVQVHGLLGQEAGSLAQSFPYLADGFMRLLLGCTMDPVNPDFEVCKSGLK